MKIGSTVYLWHMTILDKRDLMQYNLECMRIYLWSDVVYHPVSIAFGFQISHCLSNERIITGPSQDRPAHHCWVDLATYDFLIFGHVCGHAIHPPSWISGTHFWRQRPSLDFSKATDLCRGSYPEFAMTDVGGHCCQRASCDEAHHWMFCLRIMSDLMFDARSPSVTLHIAALPFGLNFKHQATMTNETSICTVSCSSALFAIYGHGAYSGLYSIHVTYVILYFML